MNKEELEKEAEKWVEKNLHNTEEDYIKAFKDGAEFGYNKANEWHYPSKGEYPDNDNDILCQIDSETFEVGYFNENYNNFFTIDGKEIKVKVWKEIVQSR